MPRRVTLKDIARATGVHPSTVSRALAPDARAVVSRAAVDRIVAVAEAMGYRGDQIARSLRTGRSRTVGVVVPDITNPVFPPILRGIEQVLEPAGYAPLVVNTDNIAEREARLLRALRERGVDGVIHAAVLRDSQAVGAMAAEGVPVVTLNRRVDGGTVPSVINDEAEGMRLALTHLADLGHRRIAAIAGPSALSTGDMRDAAMRATLPRLGLPLDDRLIVAAETFAEAEGRRCTDVLLSRGIAFTAIACANDRLALGALDGLQAAGLACPDDVSVTGFNDMPMLDRIAPRLTTVRIGQAEAGACAAEWLLDMIHGSAPAAVGEIVLPVALVIGESTAPPTAGGWRRRPV